MRFFTASNSAVCCHVSERTESIACAPETGGSPWSK
jgi:hypothetical protein